MSIQTELNIEMVPIAEIHPYQNNPRNNAEAIPVVKKSIQEFGFKVPIVLDVNGEIVCGHTRYFASQELGLEKLPCVRASDLSEEQIRAFRLADNATTEFATWDDSKLLEELQAIENIAMADFGFDEEKLIPEPDVEDVVEVDEPETGLAVRCKEGDVWQLGQHVLLCGDATKEADVARLMGGQLADMLVTDPPYNVDYVGKTQDALKIQNDSQDDEHFLEFLTAAFTAVDKVLKPGGAFYVWHADSEGYNFRTAARLAGWQVRQVLVWNKSTMVMGRQDYQWKHEPCLYGWKDGAVHYFVDDRTQTTVLDEKKPTASELHPTMKPVQLIARLIANSSRVDDTVLDVFGGSGTTVLACEQLKRKCRIMELSPAYCDVILKRWEDLTGRNAIKIG